MQALLKVVLGALADVAYRKWLVPLVHLISEKIRHSKRRKEGKKNVEKFKGSKNAQERKDNFENLP